MIMKIKHSILWFIAVVIVLMTLVFWFKKKPVEIPLIVSTETNATPPATTTIRTNMPMQVDGSSLNNTGHSADVLKEYRQGAINKIQAMRGVLAYNDVPIIFYGRVEDQFSNVIADATVNFGVRIYNGYESTVESGQTISDANGFFKISGYKGESLGIGVKKEGYVFVSMNGSGIYSKLYPEEQRAHPDQNNPTVIKMWKLQGAEPLVGIDQHYKLPYTAAPINFDLLAGQIVPSGGDIKITVSRPAGIISGRDPQDWSVQIEAVNGGLIETSVGEARVTYAAPNSGYEPSKTFTMSNGSNTWYEAVHQMFFVQSRNGQVYGKVNFSLRINQNPDDFMSITLSGVASTNGSRNWEASIPQ